MSIERDQRLARALERGWRLTRVGLGLAALVGGLAGCDEQLPGFADPPPYDSGEPDLDAAADDDGG